MFAIKATSFILIHNHPQGDPTPSESDLEAVEELKEQAKVMNVKLLDFLIVGDMEVNSKKKSYWSLFEEESGGDEYTLGVCRKLS
jgi:DNA repair protein RadC